MGFQRLRTIVLYGLAIAIPTALLVSSARVFTALENQKAIYLRSRVAAVASHLETMSDEDSTLEILAQEEPALVDLKTFRRADAPWLQGMWDGVELFQTQTLTSNGVPIFRALVPFHREGEMRIAQIDLDAGAADFLLEHARHQVWIAVISAFALATLSIYAVWAARRTYLLEQQQLNLKHLAHLGEMSAGLAHEIRNPLGTIKGFAQLLAESADTSQKPLIEPIVSETLRLEALVQDLLRFGRPPLPAIRQVDWQAIEQALAPHAEVFDGRFQASGEQFTLRTDPNLLEQVLLNLL
ncbi:MAG: hypothetical protein IT564_11640, partial [Rhodospirillales bacterium]|nr:hypothetical protein [Rhodospirillales bacterium]